MQSAARVVGSKTGAKFQGWVATEAVDFVRAAALGKGRAVSGGVAPSSVAGTPAPPVVSQPPPSQIPVRSGSRTGSNRGTPSPAMSRSGSAAPSEHHPTPVSRRPSKRQQEKAPEGRPLHDETATTTVVGDEDGHIPGALGNGTGRVGAADSRFTEDL